MGTLTIPGRCVICDIVLENEKSIRTKSQEQLKEVDKKRLERTQKKLARLSKKKAKEQRRLERIKNKAFREQKKSERLERKGLKEVVKTISIEEKEINISSKNYSMLIKSLRFKKLPDELKINDPFTDRYIVRANDKENPASGEAYLFKKFFIDKSGEKFIEMTNSSGGTTITYIEELRRFIKGHDKIGHLRDVELVIDKFKTVANACRYTRSKKEMKKKK